MPLKTLAIVGVASAAAGVAAASAYLQSRRERAHFPTPTEAPPASRTTTSTIPSPILRTLDDGAAPAPVDPNGLFQYGFPGPIADLRTAPSLTSSFDRRTRNPFWVAEHITPESLAQRNGDRKHSYFAEDHTIPDMFRAKLADYARSGYDRGHQVPAADAKWSQEAMDATFALSNMCPQVGDGFNRDYWAHVEDFCRRLTTRYPSVRIVTGPLYLPRREADGKWRVSYEVIGNPPNVAVPTHFYKVVFAEDGKTGGDVAVGAFVLPNAEIANDRPLAEFEVPLAIVERASGLTFAERLPAVRTKRLCREVECSLIVKEYADRQKQLIAGSQPPSPGRTSRP